MVQIPLLKLFCVCSISGEIKGKVTKRNQQSWRWKYRCILFTSITYVSLVPNYIAARYVGVQKKYVSVLLSHKAKDACLVLLKKTTGLNFRHRFF
jgi:hypothetical protein